MISAINISKNYGGVRAVDSWSVEVKRGELYGLIGPDGAGKTTFFRLLTTMLLPDGGSATVAGMDIVKDFKKIRRIFGYMPGKFSLYEDLTVEENLRFFAALFETTIEQNIHLVEEIYSQLRRFADRPAGKLSGGMKQKLALCCAMIHSPEVLFLDEPTTGVDVVSRREFWEMLKTLKSKGLTIMVSTPYMDEAQMCDRIALVSGGRFLGVDTPENTVKNFDGKLFSVSADSMKTLTADLKAFPDTITAFSFGDSVHLRIRDNDGSIDHLRQYLSNYKNLVISEIQPAIEDCFMAKI
ncbi:MAG: ABC transporter ATP-binding protein [Bacteroidales bacterium]|nr:ABC transporter ATP-binding protein [Bacteroidales bacterium]